MIYPIREYSAKAILFYQGESNCEYPQYYGPLLQEMVSEWRSLFGESLPFYMAEVTYWLGDGPVYEEDPFDGVRKAQHEVESKIPDCYLIPTYDLGFYNDLHPQNKKEVALRFFEKFSENES
jgi:sialate O-acetylesterase